MSDLKILENTRDIKRIKNGVIITIKQKQEYPQNNVNSLIKSYKESLKINSDFLEKYEEYEKIACESNKKIFEDMKQKNIEFIEKMDDVSEYEKTAFELLDEELKKRQDFLDNFDRSFKETKEAVIQTAKAEKEKAKEDVKVANNTLKLWSKYEK
jgi:hypothetical protein